MQAPSTQRHDMPGIFLIEIKWKQALALMHQSLSAMFNIAIHTDKPHTVRSRARYACERGEVVMGGLSPSFFMRCCLSTK